MGLRIQTNVAAMNSQRNLGINNEKMNDAMFKLASGYRINKAADDAAGLSISEKLRAQVRSMGQAKRNASDAISLVQTAEGGVNEISNILIRLRELSIQAASDTVGDVERGFTNKEFQQLKDEVLRISKITNFNGISLLDGTGERLEFQVGINNNPEQNRLTYAFSNNNLTPDGLKIDGLDTLSKHQAQQNLGAIDVAINHLNNDRSELGALQNRLSSTINNLGISLENHSAAMSRIKDTDMASETSELAKQKILSEAGVSVLTHANSSQFLALKLLQS